MYTTSAIAPVIIVHRLAHAGLLGPGSRVVLISSEAGSITIMIRTRAMRDRAFQSMHAMDVVVRWPCLMLRPLGTGTCQIYHKRAHAGDF